MVMAVADGADSVGDPDEVRRHRAPVVAVEGLARRELFCTEIWLVVKWPTQQATTHSSMNRDHIYDIDCTNSESLVS